MTEAITSTCGHPGGHGVEESARQRTFVAFIQVMRSHQQLLMRKLAEHGAHPGQLFCLKALSSHDGISQSELAEILQVARPTVTVMLQKMEKNGLVERRVDEQDQRYTRIHLTEDGWALHEEVRGVFDEMIDAALGSVTEEDQQELTRLLGELHMNLQRALDGMPPPGTCKTSREPETSSEGRPDRERRHR
jgi:DNA-binding MarR family transcriptional regulator